MATEGTVGLLPSDPCRGLPRGREGTLSQPLWPGHSQMERGLSRLRCTEGLMGPLWRSRSSGPRELSSHQPVHPLLPGGPWAGWPGWMLTAGGCRVRAWVLWAGARGARMRLSRVACPSSPLGVSRLLPSSAATAPEKCLLGVAEGLSRLAAGPQGVSGTRPQVRDLGPCADASCGWGGVLGPPGPRAPGTEWDPPLLSLHLLGAWGGDWRNSLARSRSPRGSWAELRSQLGDGPASS